MKIAVFDIDGTLTDYNRFVHKRAAKYFMRKYNMQVANPYALEIEDVFEIKQFYTNQGMAEAEAEYQTSRLLNDFWFSYNCICFFVARFRKGVASYIRRLRKDGYEVEFHTSRAKACSLGLIGKSVRFLTWLQFVLNGVFVSRRSIHFYENDAKKIQGILNCNPVVVYDDKPEILERLKEEIISVICVNGLHNQMLSDEKFPRIFSFAREELGKAIEKSVGQRTIKYYQREVKSAKVFRKIKVLKPLMLCKFRPVVLNADNIYHGEKGVIYAPNHRSTWDPIIITGILGFHIHWAALLRFFEGKDSIFNNSKSPILCRLTSVLFKRLEYFPIERKSDNNDANNLESVRNMNYFLKIRSKIGIFAEGTTRRPEGNDFGTFDPSFILLAKKNKAVIQPITVLWTTDKKQKIIVNLGESILPEKLSVEETMKLFLETQTRCLRENEEVMARLS